MSSSSITKELCFSESFLKVEYLSNVCDFKITGECILINLDKEVLELENNRIGRFESGVFCNIQISEINEALLVYPEESVFNFTSYKHSETIMNKWDHVYKIFPYEDLKNVKLWRSPKERIGNIEYNLWYAPEKTHCAIHNEHDFSEIHTQVYGLGYMQKFYKNDYNSLYQTIGMLPGTSHKKFCNDKYEYPWHQYLSDTDCIWLVIEEYEFS
jgi:hypothetical protein